MGCGGKIKQTCGVKQYAPCVQYELDIPEFSSLSGESCVDIEQTTNDLYGHVGNIKEEINLSALGQLCLTYVTPPAVAKVKDILLKYEEEICNLKTKVEVLETTAICDMSIEDCNLDLSGITTQCETPIQTLGELLSYLIIKVNE